MYSTKDVYPLEDIVKALKAKGHLRFNAIDALECPTKSKFTEVHLEDCPGIPGDCERCQTQKCKQFLEIYSENVKLHTLTFYFLVKTQIGSGTDGRGFIPKKDNRLKQLIKHENLII
jgi:hypothetical protein